MRRTKDVEFKVQLSGLFQGDKRGRKINIEGAHDGQTYFGSNKLARERQRKRETQVISDKN